MKPLSLLVILFALMFTGSVAHANNLNDVVKEARKQGQVLSAKTRQGMHEVRVVTPQGSVKTIRKPVSQNNQHQPQPTTRPNPYQQPTQTLRQPSQRFDNNREYRNSRQPEFRTFQRHPSQSVRPSQSTRPLRNHRPTSPPQPRRQSSPRRSDDRDPD
ncbi:hypothetical protein [Marinicella gelatinilytica]|uniref:hypothetical protein n=1 Tax=Marinicella gelatinilytica TaxID=2996017 RepID=UPI002260F432|nr:hypothetical protein [Marinicella gelatinilytica]MCX7545100.1 hypothetical protein [Marinicella gelatinilytica]